MTDGRFFSQLHCQEMQEAWQHCGNGQIRPGRHPQMNPKSFPKFHENAGHPGSVFSLGGGTKGNQTKRTCRRSFYRHPAGFLTSGWTLLTHRVCLQGFKGRPEPVSLLAFCRRKQCWPCSIAVLVSFWRESKQKRWLRLSPWWCFPASEEHPSLFTKVEWCIWLSHVWKLHLFPPLTY